MLWYTLIESSSQARLALLRKIQDNSASEFFRFLDAENTNLEIVKDNNGKVVSVALSHNFTGYTATRFFILHPNTAEKTA